MDNYPAFNGQLIRQSLSQAGDAAQVYADLALNHDASALLESADISSRKSVKSLLLVDACLRIECLGQKVSVKALNVNGQSLLNVLVTAFSHRLVHSEATRAEFEFVKADAVNEDDRLKAENPLHLLRVLQNLDMAGANPDNRELPLLVGGIGFDFLATFEELPEVAPGFNTFPDFRFLMAETVVKIDHAANRTEVFGACFNAAEAARLHSRVAELVQSLKNANDDSLTAVAYPGVVSSRLQRTGDLNANLGRVRSSHEEAAETLIAHAQINDADFSEKIVALQENVSAGDIYQVVPARGFTIACPDAFAAYLRLRERNPSPYMFFIQDRGEVVFGASPEAAVTFTAANREVSMYPVAGTRPRGLNPNGSINHELDTRAELDLKTDAKELAEHIMLVDLARNDLARIAVSGTRKVAKLLDIDRYSRLMHLVSKVVAQLRPDLDALDAYRACMNMGTLSGAPKVRATQLLRECEGERRGAYGGAIGYLQGNGDMDTCIVIRSAFVKDGQALVQAGVGVVRDSDPQTECDESVHKASAVLIAIAQSQGKDLEIQR